MRGKLNIFCFTIVNVYSVVHIGYLWVCVCMRGKGLSQDVEKQIIIRPLKIIYIMCNHLLTLHSSVYVLIYVKTNKMIKYFKSNKTVHLIYFELYWCNITYMNLKFISSVMLHLKIFNIVYFFCARCLFYSP